MSAIPIEPTTVGELRKWLDQFDEKTPVYGRNGYEFVRRLSASQGSVGKSTPKKLVTRGGDPAVILG